MQAQTSREYSGDDEVVDGNRADKKRKEVLAAISADSLESCSCTEPDDVQLCAVPDSGSARGGG